MSVPASTLATISLTTRMLPAQVKPLAAREFWPLARRMDPAKMLGLDVTELAREAGLALGEAERVLQLLDRVTAVALALERLEQAGIWTLTPEDDGYPARLVERLGDSAPPLLHGVGEVRLLDGPGLGIVGSRDVTPDGAAVARQAAEQAAQGGWSVVSGAARGVDQQAMSSAFDAGGAVIGVLAEALSRVVRRPDFRKAVLDGNVVFLTPYAPEAGFSPANAMGRNKVIYALSHRVLVVCSDKDKGGTWAGATEALRAGWTDVVVWHGPGEGPGNTALAARGATAVNDLTGLLATKSLALQVTKAHADQLSLDV